jgi:hypothetical protein
VVQICFPSKHTIFPRYKLYLKNIPFLELPEAASVLQRRWPPPSAELASALALGSPNSQPVKSRRFSRTDHLVALCLNSGAKTWPGSIISPAVISGALLRISARVTKLAEKNRRACTNSSFLPQQTARGRDVERCARVHPASMFS